MKKGLFAAFMLCFMSLFASAQTKVVKDETTVKKTATPGEKVHNTFSKNKKYNGKKVKRVKKTETTAQ